MPRKQREMDYDINSVGSSVSNLSTAVQGMYDSFPLSIIVTTRELELRHRFSNGSLDSQPSELSVRSDTVEPDLIATV